MIFVDDFLIQKFFLYISFQAYANIVTI